MRKFYLLSTLVLTILFSRISFAQDFSNKGKNFWISYPQHVNGTGSIMGLYITSDVNTSGTITINGNVVPFTITANSISPRFLTNTGAGINVIGLNTYVHLGGLPDGIKTNAAIHVTALKPVVVYAHIINTARSGASLILPTNVWGKEYIVPSYANSGGGSAASGQGIGELNIMASLPNTVVEITPAIATASGRPAGVPYQITLVNPGDVYQVQFPQHTDLSGTKVKSIASASSGCQPIAVVSATTWSGINCNSGNGGDNFYQQLFPTGAWGKNFITSPLKKTANPADHNNDIVRVYVKDPTTVVQRTENGVVSVLAGLTAGGFYEYTTEYATYLQADKPVQVIQFVKTQSCGIWPSAANPTQSDPEMVALSAVEQTINDITVYSAFSAAVPGGNSAINTHYINVVMKTANTGSFRINGLIPASPFVPIPGTVYSYLKENINSTISRLRADSGFNAIAYGFGQVESYGYNAGTNVKDLYQQIGVSSQYGIEPAPSVCKGSPFKFKVSLPYCADSIKWNLNGLPGPPIPSDITMTYANCAAADSTTTVNGVSIYWYSLPSTYTFNVSGAFPVSITTFSPNTDGCGTEQEIDFELNIYDPPVADFTFAGSGCVAEPVQFTDNTTTPRPSYIWEWDFGDPPSGGSNTSGLQNPTHTFSGPGPYSVTFRTITTPGCISDPITKLLDVKPVPTATITGAASVCINSSPGPDITFTGTGGTLPYTFTYNINSGPNQTVQTTGTNTFVTFQAPTNVAGTFRYNLVQIKNTGSTLCATTYPNSFVDVVVSQNTGLTLNAGSNDNQAVCQNTAIADIFYTIGGDGNNATVTGLPTGVTYFYDNTTKRLAISGTPVDPTGSPYTYTVTATGLCLPNNVNGTITVNPDADIAFQPAGGSDNQTVCINTSIAQIQYLVTGGGTNAVFSGFPPGVSGNYAGGNVTILGSPTAAGVYNYMIRTTGTCRQDTVYGTITVTADATIALTSAGTTTSQTVCINHAIADITYQTGGTATTGNVTFTPALPGVSFTYTAGEIRILGTPTLAGVFNYTATADGPCADAPLTGTITVTAESVVTHDVGSGSEAQEVCFNTTIVPIRYNISGSAASFNFSGLPTGITATISGNTLTITGAPTQVGTFNYTVNPVGPCVENGDAGTITVNPLPTASFSVTPPSCETRVITFNDLSAPNVGTLSTWAWDFGDGVGTSPNASPGYIYPAAGTYPVTLTVTNSKGCISNPIATQSVTINARPKAGFMVPEVCINDVATSFTDTSSIASGSLDPAGYYWDFGDPGSGAANFSTAVNGSHLYTAIGSYTVMHVVTSALGCKDTVYNDIFINAADPVSDFTISNLAALCSNDSISLVNRSTISQGSVTKLEIYWDAVGAPGTFQTINVPVFNAVYKHKYPTLQTTQNYTIRMVAYSGSVCFSNRTQTVTVYATPRVQFNNMPDACLDAVPFQITQASETGGVAGSGTFSGPGVSSSGIFNPASVGPGTYTILYTYTSTAGGCVDTLSKQITVLDSASARFTYSALACERSSVGFNSSTSTIPAASGTITGWNWDFGDPASGGANTSTQPNPSHTFTSWGNYNVSLYVTTSNGCRSTLRTIQVYVNPLPRPNFTFPPGACLPSATIAFNNTSAIPDGTEASFGFLWNFGDPGSGGLNTSTGSSPSHIYSSMGPFSVNLEVTSGAGCVRDTTIIVNTIHPEPTGSFTTDKNDICVGQSFLFTDNSNPADGTTSTWSWNMGDGNVRTSSSFTYTYGSAGAYDVTLFITNSHGCRSTTATRRVTVNNYPVVNAGPDLYILEDGSDTIQPVITAVNPTYLWTPNMYFLTSNTIMNPIVKGVDDITYTLTVTGQGGCVRTDQVFIKVLKGPEIPNIFSPNGDGVHDQWVIKYLDTYPGGTVDIFNRYGQLIFHAVGYSTPWDGKVNGKEVPVGTYYYIVNPKNGRAIMSGYVDVIR